MQKDTWYYENSITGEITSDKWLAQFWVEIDHTSVMCWRWSEVCQEWLDFMEWLA